MRKTALMGWSVMLVSAWEEHVLRHVVKTVIVETVVELVRAMPARATNVSHRVVLRAAPKTKIVNSLHVVLMCTVIRVLVRISHRVLQHVVKTVIVGTVAESVRAMLVNQGSARSYPVRQVATLTKTANSRCVAHVYIVI